MISKTITAAIALLGLAVSTAQAGGPAQPEGTAQTMPTLDATEQALQGRRAVRDSVTGKLRAPTPEEEAAMNAARKSRSESARNAPVAPMVVRQHADGMRSAVLGPEYLSTLKAERQSDGKLVVRHANPAHEHSDAVKPNTATRTNE